MTEQRKPGSARKLESTFRSKKAPENPVELWGKHIKEAHKGIAPPIGQCPTCDKYTDAVDNSTQS